LDELKLELSRLKQTSQSPREEPEGDASGFLSEDEDETIALTGDELDNILNTADITEETVEGTESPEDQDFIDFPVEAADMEVEEPELEEQLEPLDLEPDEPELVIEPEPQGMADEEVADLLVDEEDIIPLETEDNDFADLDIDEPVADTADQMETIDLDQSAELLGEILTADDESLEEVELEAEPADLEFEAIELEEEIGESEVEELDDVLDVEDIGLESSDTMEPDLELEEILDEGMQEAPVEELELDIDNEIEEEVEELAVDAADEMEDVDFVDLADADEELSLDEDVPDLDIHGSESEIPDKLKQELRSILGYMDHLLESLPEDKIQEFAQSDHFETYKKLFEELGLEQ